MYPITEIIGIIREVAWLPWAVSYFFLIGLSVGAFALSLPHYLLNRPGWERIGRLGVLGALAAGLAAPVALLADLHQPGRLWHFYAYPNPSSWMAWGAFFIPTYLGGLVLYAWMAMRPAIAADAPARGLLAPLYRALGGPVRPRLLHGFSLLTAGGAALVLLYTGMEVMVVRARPVWNTPFLPVQFALTAFAGAAGFLLLLDRLTEGRDPGAEVRLNRVLALFLITFLFVGAAWFSLGAFGLESTHVVALASMRGNPVFQDMALWGLGAALGAILLALLRPATSGWCSGLLALHAAWMLRWTVFIGGQSVPKTGPGFYDYQLPMGPSGLLGIVGSIGLLVFFVVFLDALLPPARERPAKERSARAQVNARA